GRGPATTRNRAGAAAPPDEARVTATVTGWFVYGSADPPADAGTSDQGVRIRPRRRRTAQGSANTRRGRSDACAGANRPARTYQLPSESRAFAVSPMNSPRTTFPPLSLNRWR